MSTTGRGAWSKIGMPPNGGSYYELLDPIRVGSSTNLGPDFQAVNYGVRAIQKRINGLHAALDLPQRIVVDGEFGPSTHAGLLWAQRQVGVAVDGQFGPKTSLAFFWPVIQEIAGNNAHTVGGICAHESGFDPGAVGFSTPDDHGLVQINAKANPKITITQAFDHRFAFKYCSDRIAAALAKYHNVDIAVCSYASPVWAEEWFRTNIAPNQAMRDYADWVRNWVP